MLQYLSFEEDENVREVEVSFRMRSDELEPKAISFELGIEPLWCYKKGEEYLGKQFDVETKTVVPVKRNHPWGGWAISSNTFTRDKKVENHLIYLLQILEPKKGVIQRYLQDEQYVVSFYIKWKPIGEHGSYEISSDVLKRANELCHYIEFSFTYTEATTDR